MKNEHIDKQEILHLLVWLSGQPPQQSIGYMREALADCMDKLNLSEEEIDYFANRIKIEAIVLGDEIPEDEQTRQVYEHFMKYLFKIKNQ